MPPLGDGLYGCKRIVPFYGGGVTILCLLSSFLLFKTRYVRYLMALRCMFFMRVLMVDFGIFIWISLFNGVFVYNSSNSDRNGDGLPSNLINFFDTIC